MSPRTISADTYAMMIATILTKEMRFKPMAPNEAVQEANQVLVEADLTVATPEAKEVKPMSSKSFTDFISYHVGGSKQDGYYLSSDGIRLLKERGLIHE